MRTIKEREKSEKRNHSAAKKETTEAAGAGSELKQ